MGGGGGHFAKSKRRTQSARQGEGKENYLLLFSPSSCKEERLDCSKNYGEGVSKLRNRLQESKHLSFLCPRRGVLPEIVIFFFPSLLFIT